MSKIKALFINTKANMDMGDVLQIAKKEGSNLFRKPNKVSVIDILRSHYGVIAVVQNLDGCTQKKRT